MIHELFPGAGGKTPDMDASERKIWAASHNLPSHYMLVTVNEMLTMRGQMNAESTRAEAFKRTFDRCDASLTEYHKTEPDLPNAVAAAAFNAKKWKTAETKVLPQLRKARDNLKAVREMVAPHVGAATMLEIHNLGEKILEAIDMLEKQSALRRERVK